VSSYKRNQVEQAIGLVLEPRSHEPSTELRTRLKRLLETDRAHGRNTRSSNPELSNYAFYSAEAPGSGVEIWFSKYEAFALLIGHQMMQHGWPQGFAVSLLRRVRPEMEKEHARVLKLNPAEIFDEKTIMRNAREGDFAFDTTVPVLLTIASKSANSGSNSPELIDYAICHSSAEAMQWAWKTTRGAYGFTLFELTTVAHRLARTLDKTKPRGRGRSL
jgi:hypothetical protein